MQEGLDRREEVVAGDDKSLAKYMLEQTTLYNCSKCGKIYFGGMIDCANALGQEMKATKEDLCCQECQLKATGAGQEVCEKHGLAAIDWKCMYCCSVALWHCFGTHYFCDRCHNEYCQPPYNHVELRDCGGVNCPLGVPHPPASADHKKSTYPLGCNICRSEKMEKMREINNLIPEVSLKVNEYQRPENAENPLYARRVNQPAQPAPMRRPMVWDEEEEDRPRRRAPVQRQRRVDPNLERYERDRAEREARRIREQ